MPQIVVENLSKSFRVAERTPGFKGALLSLVRRRYRHVHAIDGVSFSIDAGELLGYIGPNGAGKSTTLKVLAGILVPDAGSRVSVLGRVPWQERVAHVAGIGVVFGQRSQLWWDLPVIDSLQVLGRLYRVPPARYRRSLDELVALLELGELLDTPARQLSLGQRMRCDLAASLLHEPKLLFLDEPTIGLDAQSKLRIRDFVRTLNRERGVTVILTTHDMDDIEALCRRVLVIGRGKILCDGTLEALRRKVSRERHLIVDLENSAEQVSLDAARVIGRDGHRCRLAFDPEQISAAALISQLTARHAVRDLFVENPPIDTIIERLYQAPAPDAASPAGSTVLAEVAVAKP
jgi:ABC-2 type transport system ATP-binding protein